MLDNIFGVFISLPVIIILILSIFRTRDMIILGNSLFYKEEPEPTDGYISYVKHMSIIALLILISIFIGTFNKLFGFILFIVSIFVVCYFWLLKD